VTLANATQKTLVNATQKKGLQRFLGFARVTLLGALFKLLKVKYLF
jgi:hypothetical protein